MRWSDALWWIFGGGGENRVHVHASEMRPCTNFLGTFISAAEASKAAAPPTFAGSIEAKCW